MKNSSCLTLIALHSILPVALGLFVNTYSSAGYLQGPDKIFSMTGSESLNIWPRWSVSRAFGTRLVDRQVRSLRGPTAVARLPRAGCPTSPISVDTRAASGRNTPTDSPPRLSIGKKVDAELQLASLHGQLGRASHRHPCFLHFQIAPGSLSLPASHTSVIYTVLVPATRPSQQCHHNRPRPNPGYQTAIPNPSHNHPQIHLPHHPQKYLASCKTTQRGRATTRA